MRLYLQYLGGVKFSVDKQRLRIFPYHNWHLMYLIYLTNKIYS